MLDPSGLVKRTAAGERAEGGCPALSTEVLVRFETAPAPEATGPLFRNRYDTKYLFSPERLEEVLLRLAPDYRISRFGPRLLQKYESVYFDDPGLRFYRDHQRGKLSRCKVRLRLYPAAEHACLEVKMKTNRGATRKWRREIARDRFASGSLGNEERRFVERMVPCPGAPLAAVVRVCFTRLALQAREGGERVTFDLGLLYRDPAEQADPAGSDFVVAEAKQASRTDRSPFRRLMKELRIAPAAFSKYCYGVYLFHPQERHNLLKRRYLALEKKWNVRPERAAPPSSASRSVHGPDELR